VIEAQKCHTMNDHAMTVCIRQLELAGLAARPEAVPGILCDPCDYEAWVGAAFRSAHR
jgi:hypothetical protein